MPENRWAFQLFTAFEKWHHAFAIKNFARGNGRLGRVQKSGKEVEVDDRRIVTAAFLDDTGPDDPHRFADAALIVSALIAAKSTTAADLAATVGRVARIEAAFSPKNRAANQPVNPPSLQHFASLWTLAGYPGGNKSDEWNVDQKLATVKTAGFDGFQWFAQPEFTALSARHDLKFLGCCASNAENYVQHLQAFVPLQPERINVHLGNDTMSPHEAAAPWIVVTKMADDLGLVADLETHRGTCTETHEVAATARSAPRL